MELPFDTAPNPETHTVGTECSGQFKLPKLYSVTPKEEVAISESLRKAGSGNDISALKLCHCEIAALALQRKPKTDEFDPAEVTPEVMTDLPGDLVEGLFDYLLAERRGWKEPEPAEDSDPNSTGVSTSHSSSKPSPTTTTDSQAAGPTVTDTKPSATSRSKRSAAATKATSK